jgi:anti-sigma factor RsiW
MTNYRDNPKFTSYALGELDPAERADVEALLARDPAARQALHEIQSTAGMLTVALRAEAGELRQPNPALASPRDAAGERLVRFAIDELDDSEHARVARELRRDARLCQDVEALRQTIRMVAGALRQEPCPPPTPGLRDIVLREAKRRAVLQAIAVPRPAVPAPPWYIRATLQLRGVCILFLPSLVLVGPLWAGGAAFAERVYAELLPGQALPTATRLVIVSGRFLQANWLPLAVAAALLLALPLFLRLNLAGTGTEHRAPRVAFTPLPRLPIGAVTAIVSPVLVGVMAVALVLPTRHIEVRGERILDQRLERVIAHETQGR